MSWILKVTIRFQRSKIRRNPLQSNIPYAVFRQGEIGGYGDKEIG